uniref:Uncharacterized protein n=1 Tax=Kalanchoe fedtschenkoi TaxID=63787 RepID=A0A7N0VLM4_KALFE
MRIRRVMMREDMKVNLGTEPWSATLEKRPHNLPAAIFIKQLRIPPLDKLMKSFHEVKSGGNKMIDGHINDIPQSLRDPSPEHHLPPSIELPRNAVKCI